MLINDKIISSIYNYCFSFNEDFFVYNSISTKIYKINKKTFELLKERTILDYINRTVPELIKILYQKRVLVPLFENETRTVNHVILRSIYENKLNVTIIPTQACNFRCVYCFEEHENNKMSDEIEKAVINYFRRNINKFETVKISWFGGEPLLEKDKIINIMSNICKTGKEQKVPVLAEITTNGYLLDIETFKNLLNCNILYYEITIDGQAQFHNKLRPLANGKATYDRIIHNLKQIQREVQNRRFKIVIRTNINSENALQYKEFVKELSGILKNDTRFEFLASRVVDWGGNSVKTIKNTLFTNNESVSQYIEFTDNQKKLYTPFAQDFSSLRCVAGKNNGFVIMPDGSVNKCAKVSYSDYDRKTKELNNYGKITNTGTLIIQEEKNAQFLQLAKPLKRCKNCSWLPLCLMTSCPLKTNSLQCKLDYPYAFVEIEQGLISMILKGNYIDASNLDI